MYRSLLRQYPRSPTQQYGYNASRSDVIPLHRDVTDTRPDLCHAAYYNVSGLPNISVIIPFFNEALSVLLRTVHSILSTTPGEILLEIILVDDQSTYHDVGRALDIYLAALSKVKVSGVNPRQAGVMAATTMSLGHLPNEQVGGDVKPCMQKNRPKKKMIGWNDWV